MNDKEKKELEKIWLEKCERSYRQGVHQATVRATNWLRQLGCKKAAVFMEEVAAEASRLRYRPIEPGEYIMLLEEIEKRIKKIPLYKDLHM